jgi:hypothetical protein
VYDAADELDAATARGDRTDYHTRAEMRARAGYAAQVVVDAMTVLVNVHCAGSFAESNRTQQSDEAGWFYSNDAFTSVAHHPVHRTPTHHRQCRWGKSHPLRLRAGHPTQ